nr:MAG TPA: hypothetical protein [Bacteriophage sp.]
MILWASRWLNEKANWPPQVSRPAGYPVQSELGGMVSSVTISQR